MPWFKQKMLKEKNIDPAKWYVYMLECSDGSIYIGITNDIDARLAAHNSGKGAKYTRGRTPVSLKVSIEYDSKSEAAKAEYAFKQLSREEKLKFIRENFIGR
jgi:putative endonuclease